MKSLIILGVLALFMLLVIPGAVSAADAVVSVSGSVVDEDLTVTAISPNVGAGAFMFANEPNVISVTVTNSGGLDAGASTVEVIVGSDTYTAAVPAITAGGSATVTVTDTVSRTYASGPVSVTATADSAGVIAESNEGNNAMTTSLPLYYNGYKGKQWTDGNDMTTQATFDGRYDVIYSTGDSAYASRGWTTKTVTWSSTNLPIPAGATVTSARLYQGTSSNNDPNTYPNPNPGMSFNGVTKTPIATYKDTKGFETYNYPYGLLVYDVTNEFNPAGNTLVLTPEAPSYAIYGAYLIVVYEDSATTEKMIWINDEADVLYATGASSVSSEEATAYAPFAGVDTTDVSSAQAIAVVGSGNTPTRSKFFFNSQEFSGFGPRLTGPQLGFYTYDVKTALASGENEARLQSYDALQGTVGDFLMAMNTILIVEKSESTVTVTDLGASTTSGDADLAVTFTPTTSGYITGYAWTFGDGGTSDEATPTHTYTTAGTYTVSLTVTGVGAGNTATRTEPDYITVLEPAPVIDFTADPTSGVEPLTVAFDATNTGGAVTSWTWEYKLTGDSTWTEFATTEDTSFTFTDGTYDVRLTAEGPDYTDVETKTSLILVGASTIDVTVIDSSIDFGTMAAGVDETGSTTVNVDVTGGTAWSVTASATNGGYMGTGSVNLANPFQLSNDGTNFQAMTSNFANFMNGAAGVDGSDTADVKQAIAAADAPGAYSITLTFTGSMA